MSLMKYFEPIFITINPIFQQHLSFLGVGVWSTSTVHVHVQ